MYKKQSFASFFAVLVALFILSGCDSVKTKSEATYPHTRGNQVVTTGQEESIFGEDGVEIFSSKKKEKTESSNGIGVNKYLWQATLETLSFIPIASADPFGGVILTDWYVPDASKQERFKTQVFLKGVELKASNIKVSVLKQIKMRDVWESVATAADTDRKMEDAILAKARKLRIASEL